MSGGTDWFALLAAEGDTELRTRSARPKGDGLSACARKCMQSDTLCEEKACRQWIKFKEDKNCTLIAVYENGAMTLRETAERLGISFARVKQIEKKALARLKTRALLNE
jgi:predicted HTH transcriptional regulator